LKEAEKLSKEIKQVKQDLSQKKTLGWQDKAKLENLMSRQMELQEKIDQIKEQNKQNNMQKSEFTEMDEQLLEKQKQLEELFDKVMTDELKKLYEELQKLMEQMNKNDVQKKMDNVEMSQEELQKELDRSLELFKQLEVEQKMDEITKKLEGLAKKQDQLADETREKTKSQEELQKEQEKLNDMFQQVKEDFKELNKLNEELEDKKNIPNPEESMKNTEEQMQNSSQELQNNKNKKASESQKKAAEEMKKMQQQMESAMNSMSMEQNQEDMNAIRQLLENLIKLSLDQEDLMQQLASTRTADPKFLKLAQEQRKLEDDAKVIEDSLLALSKRQIAIQSIVNQEIAKVKSNMSGAKENMEERNIGAARTNQQYVMTSLNNLALLLDQALQQMQSQARSQSQSSGSGSCNNPGGTGKGKPGQTPSQSMESIRKMQEELAKTLEQMKKNLEGQNPNGQKPGQKPGQMPGLGQPGQGGLSAQEMAELAAKQEALRKKLDELGNKMNEDGSGSGNGLKKIAEEMEKNEKDIVNLNITRETMMRQQEIMTKLLESEKAIREKEQDEKRESNEAKNQEISNSFQFLEYKSQKEKEVELLRTIPPALTLYYKMRVNDYFNIIEK
jgi:myosin heavy subunit